MNNIFYISFHSSAGWLHPLVTRLNNASSAAVQERYKEHWRPRDSELGRLAVTVEAKLSKLYSVIDAVNQNVRLLDKELATRKSEVDQCIARQSSLVLHQAGLEFSLSASIESFLYHSRSAYELMRRFLVAFSRRILEKGITEMDIKAILEQEGIATEWIDALNDDRNLTAHESALWCDLQKVTDDPRRYEVLIGQIHEVDPEKYRPLTYYSQVYRDFMGSLTKLRDWLLRQIDGAEATHERR